MIFASAQASDSVPPRRGYRRLKTIKSSWTFNRSPSSDLPWSSNRRRNEVAHFARAVTHLAGGERFDLRVDDFYDGGFDGRAGLRFADEIQHHARCVDGGDGVDDVLAGVFGRAAAHRLEHRGAFGIDVAPRPHPRAGPQHRAAFPVFVVHT